MDANQRWDGAHSIRVQPANGGLRNPTFAAPYFQQFSNFSSLPCYTTHPPVPRRCSTRYQPSGLDPDRSWSGTEEYDYYHECDSWE